MPAMQRFRTVEHTIEGQHVREYAHGTRSQRDEALKVAIKQYIPLENASDSDNDNAVTIIACHANGIPKETYEPLWDDLLPLLTARGIKLRGIWFADSVNQGASYVQNEDTVGDDTSWLDHSRDLLHMVNVFRHEIRRPIVGIAHSMGCAHLVNLSLLHPRLLAGLFLMEPVLVEHEVMMASPKQPHPAFFAVRRPDVFPSRKAAAEALKSARAFSGWDDRMLGNYIEHGLRELPTALYPSAESAGLNNTEPDASRSNAVTLTTTKHQEAWSYTRANFEPVDTTDPQRERWLVPDLDAANAVWQSPATIMHNTVSLMRHVRPPVSFVFGKKSPFSHRVATARLLDLTGTGLGGNGGVAAGQVSSSMLNTGHFAPCEDPGACVALAADFVTDCVAASVRQDEMWKGLTEKKSDEKMLRVSPRFLEFVKHGGGQLRPGADADANAKAKI